MKVAIVTDQFDDSNNGTTITARRLAEDLKRRGHTVVVVALGETREGKFGARKHTIPVFQKLVEAQGMCFAKPDPKAYYEAFRGADIAHFFIPFRFCREGEKHARQMHIATVAGFHLQPENVTSSLFLEKFKFINSFLYWWFYKVFYNRFDFIHCPSRFIGSQIKAHRYDAKIEVISNGVAREFKKIPATRPEALKGKFLILMVGRLSREKRQDLIIEGVRRSAYADNIQIIFAGQGPREENIRHLGARLKNPPIIRFFKQPDLIELMNICDLYVHAADAEIEGISCLEAMACGLTPVISNSRNSATGQYALCDESLFRAGDPKDLAKKIDYWIEHPERKAEFSEKYMRQQDGNRVDMCVARMEDMYREAIHKTRAEGYKAVPVAKWKRPFLPRIKRLNSGVFTNSSASATRRQAFATVIAAILTPIHSAFLGLRIEGKEHLKGLSSGAVTVCNHNHPMDCTIIRRSVIDRKQWLVSLQENFEIPFVGWLIKSLGAVSLGKTARERADLFNALERRIAMGELVHFYPEGMLVPYYPTLREIHPGAFALAARVGCPVVPMALAVRKRRPQSNRRALTLYILKPIYPDMSLAAKHRKDDLMARAALAIREKLVDEDDYNVLVSEAPIEEYATPVDNA